MAAREESIFDIGRNFLYIRFCKVVIKIIADGNSAFCKPFDHLFAYPGSPADAGHIKCPDIFDLRVGKLKWIQVCNPLFIPVQEYALAVLQVDQRITA